MTTQKAISGNESPLIGEVSKTPSSDEQRVIYLNVEVRRPIHLDNTVSLDSLVSELEADEEMSRHLAEARQELSASLYSDEQETLSSIRLAAGLSQNQLAERIGTSQSYIARVESGRVDPGTDMVARFAEALHVSEELAFRAIRNQFATRG